MTSFAQESIELGQPVSVSAIGAGLNQLWEENETATRASLMNLVVYSDLAQALLANTQVVKALTLEHACRVLLIEAETVPTDNPSTEVWLRAHCSLGPDGRKAVCCEQVAFRMHGLSTALLHNIIFANLESDLPLVLWWQASLSKHFNQRIYRRINRLIIDSHDWQHPKTEVTALREAYQDSSKHFVIHDLNWTRTCYLRLAIAACFEEASDLQTLRDLQEIRIAHKLKHHMTAALLAGWILNRLGREVPIVFEPSDTHCQAIHGLTFTTKTKTFYVKPAEGCERYHLHINGDDQVQDRLFPSDPRHLSQLLIDQLGRGGSSAAYFQVLDRALPLL